MHNNSAKIGSRAFAGDDASIRATGTMAVLHKEFQRIRYALTEVKLEHTLKRFVRAIGCRPPAQHRWPRANNGLLEIPSLASLKWNVAALRFQLALLAVAYRECKAGFDPNQPRVPRGQPGGGQWTDAGGGSGNSKPTDAPEDDRAPLRITIHPPSWYRDSGEGSGSTAETPPIEDPPSVPAEEPQTSRALNTFIKQAAYWLARAAIREVVSPQVGTFINILDAVHWGYKAFPYIKAYLAPPKTLSELQAAVASPKTGYDVHHIVEQKAAEKDGYPRSKIDAPENLVRIPTLKHWQITAWYMTRNDAFGRLSPREFLQGKDWSERVQVGRKALILYGVLKP
jgi:hypothetical protein